jgi:Protein of unknown function (DUF2827)
MARIGITCTIDEDGGFGLFSNNLRQTAFFLYRMFKKNGHAAVLLSGPESVAPKQQLLSFGIEPGDLQATASELDLVIVCSRALTISECQSYWARQGAKIVRYMGGSLALDTMAAFVGGSKSGSETYSDSRHYDQVWMLPSLAKTYRSWCEVMYGCEVKVVPPVWEPLFIPHGFGIESPSMNEEQDKWLWRIGILEPGNTVTRTAHFPLMAVAAAIAIRDDKNVVSEINVMNAEHLKDDHHFTAFRDRLGFNSENKNLTVNLLPPMVRPILIRERCDMIVSNDIEDGLDYAYFEALYGGYPLIHCSEYLEQGYRYNRFDAGAAGLQIRLAMDNHDPKKIVSDFRSQLPQLQNYAYYESLLP